MLLNLDAGTEYNFRVLADNTSNKTIGGDYYFNVPGIANNIAVSPAPTPTSHVSGASITNKVTPPPTPAPTPAPAPAPKSEPEPEPATSSEGGVVSGFVNQVKNTFTSFWR